MLLGGLAAGMVLFIVSVGLSVTMGLMGFVNLAHGGFAMIGGYVIVLAMNRCGMPFVAGAGARLHRHRRASASCSSGCSIRGSIAPAELDQVLFTIGLVFIMIAGGHARGRAGNPAARRCRRALQGQINLGFMRYRTYSIFLIGVGVVIMLGLWLGFERTRMGAQIRAAVDNRRMAESLGINIDRLFTITFAFGSGMAALGGGLGAEFLGLDPQYPLKYLVMFLIVVAVGGLGRITGVFYASLIIGVLDFALKKYLPQGGTVFIYALTILLLLWRPQGLFGRQRREHERRPGRTSDTSGGARARRRHRLRWWEALPWLLALGVLFRLPALSRLRHRAADHDPVRALARSRARLCRHRHARPCRVLRRRRLHGRHAGQARHLDRADHGPDHRRGGRRRWSASPRAWCCCAPPA